MKNWDPFELGPLFAIDKTPSKQKHVYMLCKITTSTKIRCILDASVHEKIVNKALE